MDLVSVIIPIYNIERYLRRCIDSVLGQTYPNIEVILVDDGSHDKSGEICDSYLGDARVRVIHQNNKGLSGARNAGLDIRTGEWIIFVDSDDFIARNYIEEMLKLCKKYNVAVCQCGIVRGKGDEFPKECVDILEKKWEVKKLYCSKGREYSTMACAKLFKSSLFDNIRFPEGLINEDEDAIFKIMYRAEKCVLTNRHLYYYYMSSNSITRKKRNHINYDFISIFEDRIRYLENNNEIEMVNVTKKELCIRLMLRYIACKSDGLDYREAENIKNIYERYYKQLKMNDVSCKEYGCLLLFHCFPNLLSRIETRFGVIKRSKLKREKR